MKKILSVLLAAVIPASLFGVSLLHAATTSGKAVQFEIIAPATAQVNEAIDVTVRAVDADNNTVTSYNGSIIFIANGFGDTVPMQGRAITFTAEDNGQKKFSKGVIFKTEGKQKIFVTDLTDDNLSGETTVNVSAAGSTSPTPTAGENVTIITPENNTKITSDTVTVSGNTRRNSKVNIKLNGTVMGTTVSDADGIFSKTVSGVTQESNILTAEVLDASNSVIGTSSNVTITRQMISAGIYNVTVSPATTVEASSPIIFTVEGDAGMADVSINLDGVSLSAKEETAGKYTIQTVAPAKAGTYQINAEATTSLGTKASKTNALLLTITEKAVAPVPTASFKNVQAVTDGKRVTFTFWVENLPPEVEKFKIVYGDSPSGFSSEVVTFNTGRILGTDGLFHWYIDNLPSKTYYFKILGVKGDNTLVDTLSSEALSATVWKEGCSIGNVWVVTVETQADKSILSWESVSGALSYNIYKVSPAGDYTLFQNVKDTKYALYLATGSVAYENFAIKALCNATTESNIPSMASKVQTGPGSLVFLVILSGAVGAFLLRRRAL